MKPLGGRIEKGWEWCLSQEGDAAVYFLYQYHLAHYWKPLPGKVLPLLASAGVFLFLEGSNRTGQHRYVPLEILPNPLRIVLALEAEGTDTFLLKGKLTGSSNGEARAFELPLDSGLLKVAEHPSWYACNEKIVQIPEERVLPYLSSLPLRMRGKEREIFEQNLLPELLEGFPLHTNFPLQLQKVENSPIPRLYLSEDVEELKVELRFAYGEWEILPTEPKDKPVFAGEKHWEYVQVIRDRKREKTWMKRLLKSDTGLKRIKYLDSVGTYGLKTKVSIVDFLFSTVPHLVQEGAEVYGEETLLKARLNRRPATLSLRISSGIHWFEVDGEVQYGESHAKLAEVLLATQRGDKFVKLSDGSLGALPEEWMEKLRFLEAFAKKNGEGILLHTLHATLLESLLPLLKVSQGKKGIQGVLEQQFLSKDEETDSLAQKRVIRKETPEESDHPLLKQGEPKNSSLPETGQEERVEGQEPGEDQVATEQALWDEFKSLRERLSLYRKILPVALPEGFYGTLRPYQIHGYYWLHFLRSVRVGGILADDMGLGKTIQVLAYLQSLKEMDPPTKAHLLVVPKSLVYNWQEEARRFTPALRFLEYLGAKRTQDFSIFDTYDVVITTYATLLRDVEKLKTYPFHHVLLDESQAIKNPLAQCTRAARSLLAEHRMVLTGTPMENNIFELWSQFAFLEPVLLGPLPSFKRTLGNPIEKGDPYALEVLRSIIHPFILRRTKDQVAPELPPRTEELVYAEMETEQSKLYHAVRERYREEIKGLFALGDTRNALTTTLKGLLRLRQIAIHPSLYDTRKGTTGTKS
ncbi:MAG: SNF2-related protein, partial [Spirochaetales bacterium]